jgi:peroxiredoxin
MARDTVPRLTQQGHQVLLVSIGTQETGKKFAKRTGFPAAYLFADYENATYEALGLTKGFATTFLSPVVCLDFEDLYFAAGL